MPDTDKLVCPTPELVSVAAEQRQVSFADWELMRQGLRLEPMLQAISGFLDSQHDIIEHGDSQKRAGLLH